MSYIQFINVVQAKMEKTKVHKKSLTYLSGKVNGKISKAHVDIEATHNFIYMDEAKRLGLKVTQGGGTMKAVSSSTRSLEGVAHGVIVQLETWKGSLDFGVIHMDDHPMILEIELIDKVQVIPIFPFHTLCMLDEENHCYVSLIRKAKGKAKTLSTLKMVEVTNKFLEEDPKMKLPPKMEVVNIREMRPNEDDIILNRKVIQKQQRKSESSLKKLSEIFTTCLHKEEEKHEVESKAMSYLKVIVRQLLLNSRGGHSMLTNVVAREVNEQEKHPHNKGRGGPLTQQLSDARAWHEILLQKYERPCRVW